ncbi:MAG: exo-alpha-sialidase [Phycisphaeraceae bacterium]|nr:exo-alpha-sialidase [Phycisphaeraceae bacterium]
MMKKFIPNTFSTLGKQIFVSQNHPHASDLNSGCKDQPYKTITAAASVMGRYDEVVISRGVYREEIPIQVSAHMYTPEWRPTFIAFENDEVWIKGSDLFKAQWTPQGNGIYKALLPLELFEKNHYNPYQINDAIDTHRIVRPCEEHARLPRTLGQLFCDGHAMTQVQSMDQLHPGSWRVSADGKYLIAAFKKDEPLEKHFFELTMRKRCFRPNFKGKVIMDVKNICVEHAAEPGPFCYGRYETVRKNEATGMVVTKTFNVTGTTNRQCRLFTGEVSYLSKNDDRLFATVYDETSPNSQCYVYDVQSDDHALTWKRISENRPALDNAINDTFLDTEAGLLINTKMAFLEGAVPASGAGICNDGKIEACCRISRDNDNGWSPWQKIGTNLVPFKIEKMSDGTFLLPCGECGYHNGHLNMSIKVLKGTWDQKISNIIWESLSSIKVKPEESDGGLAEPCIARFPNGNLMMLLRAGGVLASQHRDGVPSVKLYSVSKDAGKTWSYPQPLTYDDGKYVYSPRSFQSLFRSSKNGQVYCMMNISDEPVAGCDPRNTLHIGEIDADTYCLKRNKLSLIEAKHPEADPMIRYSNWLLFESRKTLNPVILMRANMSEYCPVRFGYDLSSYRYEIDLPIAIK